MRRRRAAKVKKNWKYLPTVFIFVFPEENSLGRIIKELWSDVPTELLY